LTFEISRNHFVHGGVRSVEQWREAVETYWEPTWLALF
jgi:hypothetical protein